MMSVKRPSSDAVPVFAFSTEVFPERERLEAWREIFGRTVAKLDIEPLGPNGFRAEATVCQLPGLGVLRASSAPAHMVHSRDMIVDGDLWFMAAPTCQWTASQLGRNLVLGPGDGVLMNNAEPGTMTLASTSWFTTFRVPAAAIAPLVSNLKAAVGRLIPAGNAALLLLVSYLASALDTDALITPELQELAATHVYDLLAMALGGTRHATKRALERGVRAARLRSARALVMQQLGRHDLSAATVAAQLGVTPRYVHMLFETERETFSEFVLAQRLTRAHRMLTDPRFAGHAIGAIAFDVGFVDLPHFSRTFRRRFGITPSEVHAQARGTGD
jgi:AraC-like DNA-binding protein